jgi:ParB family transcriptional regulator, chromosome partitioning protein
LSTVQQFPLSACQLAPENARHASKAAISGLRDSIAAEGLLDPLHAYQDGKSIMVWDGGRRLRALKALAKAKRLPETLRAGVPVLVSDRESARRRSLVTFVRQDMHPAEEFRAYKALFDAGQDPAAIAASVGADARRVAQLLKLCALAPEVLDAFEAGAFGLDTAQAFTLTDDPDKQRAALAACGDWINAGRVRQLLKADMVSARDRLAVFVGRDAYVEAGGLIVTDLFADEHEAETWADGGLVERLAAAKLEAAVAAIKVEGWAFVTMVDPYDYSWGIGYRRQKAAPVELTDTEGSAYDEAVATLEDNDASSEAWQAAEATVAALDAKRESGEIDAEQRASAGVFVQLDAGGLLTVRRGYVKVSASGGASRGEPKSAEAVEAEGWGHVGHWWLTHVATAAVRHALLADTAAAYDILVAGLAWGLATGTASACAMTLAPRGVVPSSVPTEAKLDGEAAWAECCRDWRARLTVETFQACFDYVVAMSAEDKAEIVALGVGLSLDAVELRCDRRRTSVWSQLCAFAGRAGLKIEDVWTPNASFLGKGSKAALLAALEETGGTEGLAKAKKSELVAAVLERAARLAWMPKLLREFGQRPINR